MHDRPHRQYSRHPGRQGAAVVALLLILTGCGAGTSGAVDSTADTAQQRIEALREAAALPSCPSGLGPSLPDLTLPCLSGGPDVTLNAAGPARPMLVNIWGTWCPPCVREVPLLVDLAEQARGEIGVVGILTQDTPVNGLEFARQFSMNYTSVLDDDGVVMRQFASGPPVTLFVSAEGEIRHVKRGEVKDTDQLRKLVEEHLGIDVAARS